MQNKLSRLTHQYQLYEGKISRMQKHPFVIPVTMFFTLLFISAVAFVGLNSQTVGASDSHVVHFSINGKQQIVPTRATTVKELVARMQVQLQPEDIVEPALETPIVEDNFSVNVYRAQPVKIVDEDGKSKTILSAQPTPRLIAEKAGIELHPEDVVAAEPARDILKDGLVTQTVTIDRATPTTINLYGTEIPVRTHAATVGEVLKERNIQALPGDTVVPALDTPLANTQGIFIARVGKQIVTVEEIIPAPVETIDDPNAAAGSIVVQKEGSAGRKVVTYEVETRNDKEVARKELQTVLAAEPVTRVVVKGSKVVFSNPSANVELGRQIAAEMGYAAQFSCIYNIFERESHWNHLAQNRSSGAYGIPQALPGSKMGPGWQSDPAVQIRWGINYMSKYGGPCGAWNFWQTNHWY